MRVTLRQWTSIPNKYLMAHRKKSESVVKVKIWKR